MKPTILVDQDGPLADFDAWFWQRCREHGWEFDCAEHEQTARFATDHMPNRKERQMARAMVDNDPHWFDDLPVTPGAVEGIKELARYGDVWICTKPLEANRHCRDGKASWVRRHLGTEWETRLILAPDKSLVRGSVLLDDAIKMEWLPRAEWRPVVFPKPFNGAGSEWEHLPRWTWGDDPKRLLGMAW